MITKKTFKACADIVRNIVEDRTTQLPPTWADLSRFNTDDLYRQAVQTAESFILIFSAENPRFDVHRFLSACGLED